MGFVEEYYANIIACLLPLSMGTLLVMLSPVIKKYDLNYSNLGKVIGWLVMLLALIGLMSNIIGIIGQFI